MSPRRPSPSFHDAGHGYDLFGLHPPTLERACRLVGPLYRSYFRVDSRGIEHLPGTGAAILVANHSGALPVDAAMLAVDVLERSSPRRIPRMIEDRFLPLLPLVGALFSRLGGVSGTRANVERLLADGELVVIFPEGTAGVKKLVGERYQLQAFRPGHAELALRHGVPVVPAAIVGAEEAWPIVARWDGFHVFGAPYLPLPLTPLPMPARLQIRYGAPLRLGPGDPDDPAVVAAAAARVKAAVAQLIEEARRERRGWFQ